jgi:serine protease Do
MVTVLAWCWAVSVHAGVSPELQQAIRMNTFEVVIKKPAKDPATYEKALPLELLPFHERNDAYRSVGTAFSLGHNTYVTAGHVLQVGIGSQYGAPELRASDGTVYAIDQIRRFSMNEDFVVFSLQADPAPPGLMVNREPKLDDPVLAVGNALGEGIVIRDGLYTSATDEDQDGKWKWIRFSAAASPGNSGGPLLDESGKVIGIVIGKSPNENLNYSLPIERVLDGDDRKATFNKRALIALPFMQGTTTYTYQDDFALPLAWPAFVAAYQNLMDRNNDEARATLLKRYADTLFPKGPGSDTVLSDPDSDSFNPVLIGQQADGVWAAYRAEFNSTSLPGDGSVSMATAAGATLLRLIRSDGAADDAFYADSSAFMDLALKALNVRRTVGPDQVRVTSLGAAQSDATFTDALGRKWQERVWAVPFLDVYLVGLLLPTPDGYSAILVYSPSPLLQLTKGHMHLLAGQIGISLQGTLKQWQGYLRRRTMLPDTFAGVKLNDSPQWTLRTPRFTFAVPSTVLPLNAESPLMLTMGFARDRSRLSWEIADVRWNQDDRKDESVDLWRRERPPDGARLELRNKFTNMRDRRSPFDGQMIRDTAETFSVSQMLNISGKDPGKVPSDLVYGLTLRVGGHPTTQAIQTSLRELTAATQILEHGQGVDIVATTSVAAVVNAAYEDWVQQSINLAMQSDARIGRDIRGHLLSSDLRDLFDAQRNRAMTTPVGSAESENLEEQQKSQYEALRAYWNQYPALRHNHDAWSDFLARNGMPAGAAHQSQVTMAENALLTALGSGAPSPEWADLAHALLAAYIQERSQSAARKLSAADYRPRASACGAPADRTSGKKIPSLARSSQSLEDFWPMESKRLGEEGVVKVSIRISATGCAIAAAIALSSGFDMLDEAVMKFYETIDFYPGEIDGKPVESTSTMPIIFKLQ